MGPSKIYCCISIHLHAPTLGHMMWNLGTREGRAASTGWSMILKHHKQMVKLVAYQLQLRDEDGYARTYECIGTAIVPSVGCTSEDALVGVQAAKAAEMRCTAVRTMFQMVSTLCSHL